MSTRGLDVPGDVREREVKRENKEMRASPVEPKCQSCNPILIDRSGRMQSTHQKHVGAID